METFVKKSCKEESRNDWTFVLRGENMDMEKITFGAVLRMADSLESIDKGLNGTIKDLIAGKNWYKEMADKYEGQVKEQKKELQKLRNQLTRLKKKIP